jgi:hypothetical protein
VAKRDLHLITVTNQAVADEQKKLVWLIARQHAWEAGTSWNMDGAVRFITSDDVKAKTLRDKVIFKFVPMMDPDGVAAGKVRFNGNGYDVNRHWNEVDLRSKDKLALMPEIWYVKKAIVAQMQSAKPIDLMVNLHNTETGEYQETIVNDPAVQKLMQRFFDGLSANSAFVPSKPLVFSTAPATTTNVMWAERKVPVMLFEQRISTNKKLGRFPTIQDRLDFGAALVREMAAAVLSQN